jgi:peptidoglycan-N-acetylglucosamine deacetylase
VLDSHIIYQLIADRYDRGMPPMRISEHKKVFWGIRPVLGFLLAGLMLLEPAAHTAWALGGQGISIAREADTAEREAFARLSSGSRVTAEREYVKPEQPTVYLTFDDGPSKYTEPVLDILKQEGVKATFFVLGQLVSGRKDTLLRIKEEGHAIGNHSYDHIYKELYKDYSVFREQAEKTDALLEDILGYKPFLLRAPGGTYTNFDAFYYYYLEQAGYTVVDWNVDSRDAVRQGVTAEEITAEIRRSPLKHELVVLLHDGAGHEETVKALPDIIAYYRQQGYGFAAIGEDVAPVQFQLGKSKWSRSYTLDGFVGATDLAVAAGHARGTGYHAGELRMAAQGLAAQEEAQTALAAVPVKEEPLLRIQAGDGPEWILDSGRYSFSYDRFAVPLRGLAERLGGTVSWDDELRIATVHTGTLKVEYDPVRHTVKEQRLGQRAVVHHIADIIWKDGEIRIPLRAGTALLGGAVSGYSMGESERQVSLGRTEKPQTAILLHPMAGWKERESLKSHV